jgi:hypothetical protein
MGKFSMPIQSVFFNNYINTLGKSVKAYLGEREERGSEGITGALIPGKELSVGRGRQAAFYIEPRTRATEGKKSCVGRAHRAFQTLISQPTTNHLLPLPLGL